jgi:hypothetical protein
MLIQLEAWQLISGIATATASFAAVVWLFGTILIRQFKSSLDSRFNSQDELRKQREKSLDDRFVALNQTIRQEGDGWRQVERDFLQLKMDLPNYYVRRDDWIRFGGSIDQKMDRIHEKLDDLKGSSKHA